MATITMDLEEYKKLEGRADAAERKVREMEAEVVKSRLADPSGRIPDLVAGVRAARPIVAFAVANLIPEIVRGWPTGDLRSYAQHLSRLPDATQDDLETAMAFVNNADLIDMFERDVREPMDRLRAAGVDEEEVQRFARGRAGKMNLRLVAVDEPREKEAEAAVEAGRKDHAEPPPETEASAAEGLLD